MRMADSPMLPDLAYTLGARRNHHPYRLTLAAQSIGEVVQRVERLRRRARRTPRSAWASHHVEQHLPRVAFVMSGQGPQWWGMGRELMQHEPVFRQTIERCDAAMRPWASFSVMEELGRSEEYSQMHRTEIAQPAIFAMQVALAKLWKSWGVQPAAIVGHSVGEVAAACVAGVLSLEEAARVIVLRARFMDDCARGEGTMLAIGLDEDAARALIARHDRTVTIAAFNGPRSLTLAGSRLSLEAMAAELELDGVFARFVQVDHPFHHPLMQPASEALEEALEDLTPKAETVPFFSTVTGRQCAGRGMRRRSLGKRSAATGAVRVRRQRVDGRRCRRLAGNQRATRAGSFDSGMPRRARRQGAGAVFCSPRTRTRIRSRDRDGPASLRRDVEFCEDDALSAAALTANLRLGQEPLVE